MAAPSAVPNSAMMADSHRTLDRSLGPGHAHRPEQSELAGALVDRQRQRVGDAEQGDEDGQEEQRVHQREDLVDGIGLGLLELADVFDLHGRVVDHQLLERRLRIGGSEAPGLSLV